MNTPTTARRPRERPTRARCGCRPRPRPPAAACPAQGPCGVSPPAGRVSSPAGRVSPPAARAVPPAGSRRQGRAAEPRRPGPCLGAAGASAVRGVTTVTAAAPILGHLAPRDAPVDRGPVVTLTGCTLRRFPTSSPVAVVTGCTCSRATDARPPPRFANVTSPGLHSHGSEAAITRAAERACADTRPAVPRARRSQGGGGDPGIGRNPRW